MTPTPEEKITTKCCNRCFMPGYGCEDRECSCGHEKTMSVFSPDTPTPRGWAEVFDEKFSPFFDGGLENLRDSIKFFIQKQLEKAYKEGYIDGGLNH